MIDILWNIIACIGLAIIALTFVGIFICLVYIIIKLIKNFKEDA